MTETLTKENFWDALEQKYPKAMQHFKEWVDKYKSEHNWDILFAMQPPSNPYTQPALNSVKYHDLPAAMQFGIFCEYIVYSFGDTWEDLISPCRGTIFAEDVKQAIGWYLMDKEGKL